MNTQRLSIILTVINLAALVFVLIYVQAATAKSVPDVLRVRALELMDDQGRVRAQLIVVPATTQDGKDYPETTLFRLIDPNGRPNVKIGTSVEGSGMSLLGGQSQQGDWNGIQLLAEGKDSLIKLVDDAGREQVLKP